tara:strand:- start:1356 stop:1529 length:174 start_codon:yes stop_codon:yes gene_type:complete
MKNLNRSIKGGCKGNFPENIQAFVINRQRFWESGLRKCGLHGKIDGYVEKKPNGYES